MPRSVQSDDESSLLSIADHGFDASAAVQTCRGDERYSGDTIHGNRHCDSYNKTILTVGASYVGISIKVVRFKQLKRSFLHQFGPQKVANEVTP